VNTNRTLAALAALGLFVAAAGAADNQWVVYPGGDGPGKGKHVVLISGDEEYRSEETLPQLGKILSKHHGFQCTVLFAIDPKTGEINPQVTTNIPGTEALKTADLLVILTRFRDLPEEQMKSIDEYLQSGKPVVGLRTATHAFQVGKDKPYARYGNGSSEKGWEGGFGRKVLGEKWVNHWGGHGSQSTRGIIAPGQEKNPILRGIKYGDVWGPTDVYEAHPTKDCTTLLLGEVVEGMKRDDPPVIGKKNDPMMPIAWMKTYSVKEGKSGRSFCTTMGAATDFATEGTRRLIVNACFWAAGLEDKIPDKTDVDLVGKFEPTPFGFGKHKKGVRPSDLAGDK
jgi:type 1 glutamine amidotransferase